MRIFIFLIVFSGVALSWAYGMSSLVIHIFPALTSISYELLAFSGLGTLSFIIGTLWSHIRPHRAFAFLYKYWAIWLWAITIAWLIALVFLIVALAIGIIYMESFYLWIFLTIVVGLNIYALWKSAHPKICEYTIDIHTPHTWHGKKIVLVSDMHYGDIYTSEDAKKLVDTINTLSWEIVLIPWDLFDGPKIDYARVAREFVQIRAPYGVIFTNGNHEEYSNTSWILKAIEGAGITILNDKKIVLGGMIFAWVSYHDTETPIGFTRSLDSLALEIGKPTILLKHKPTLHTILRDYPIDLVVSGHTHRGQMWPFSLITDLMYGKYVYGLSVDGNMSSITTSGAGTWWPPQRLGTQSEIVVITIR